MKDKYAKDYEYQDVIDENGRASSKLVYTGTCHDSMLSAEDKRTLIKASLLSSFASTALLVLGGCFSSGAGRSFVVMLPYLAALCASAFFIAGALKLRTVPDRMTTKQYERSFARTARSSILTGFFAVLTVLADLVFLLRHPDLRQMPGDLILFGSALLAACLVIVYFRRNRKYLSQVMTLE